jgi:NTP pyrophosphatase (non-canonical NTP hydrolase)
VTKTSARHKIGAVSYATLVWLTVAVAGTVSAEGLMTITDNKSRISRKRGAAAGSPLDLAVVLAASPMALSVNQYQELSRTTDRTVGRGADRLDFPLLGLFGEIGSLLSELKKKQRDTVSYFGYEESVVEELGDVLWYFSNLATRAGIPYPRWLFRFTVT